MLLHFVVDRLTMHWWWLGTWRRVSQCWSTLAVAVLARQPSTFVCMQDVQCTPLLVLRRNGTSSKSNFHRYLNCLWRNCKFRLCSYLPPFSSESSYWRDYIGPWFCILFCMGLKFRFSQWGEKINWRCFRVEYWARYLCLRGWKKLETGGNCIKRSFMICAPHQMLFGWNGQGM